MSTDATVGNLLDVLADYDAHLRVVVEDGNGRQYPLDEPYGYTMNGERVVIFPLGARPSDAQ